MTRGDIKTNIRVNLADSGVTFYSDVDLNDSLQDAYNDIVALTQCILNKALAQSWIANLNYYAPITDLNLTDYLGTVAIFNNVTNQWLRDDMSKKDFDNMRRDWELWSGNPQFWSPNDPMRIVIVPYSTVATGTFDFYYYANAPTLVDDSSTFLLATDMQDLLEFYSTADLIEQAGETTKAADWWDRYYQGIEIYKERVHRINKADLLLRV